VSEREYLRYLADAAVVLPGDMASRVDAEFGEAMRASADPAVSTAGEALRVASARWTDMVRTRMLADLGRRVDAKRCRDDATTSPTRSLEDAGSEAGSLPRVPVAVAASVLHISTGAVTARIRRGSLPAVWEYGRWWIHTDDLEEAS
jgi:hypothetical protein